MGVLTILENGVEDGLKLMEPLLRLDIATLVGKEKKESLKKMNKENYFENLFIEVPTNFVPLKPISLSFDVKTEKIVDIILDYELSKRGLMMLGYFPINQSKVEISVINLNGLDLIVTGLNASASYHKHQDKSSFNGLWQNSIKTKHGQLFAKIELKD